MISMTPDGLVIPTLARRYLSEGSPELLERLRTLFLLSGTCLGILIPKGLLFEGAAMLCYSLALAGSGAKSLGG